MKSVLDIFFKARNTKPWHVLACLVLAGIFEGIGIASLLPFLSLATNEGLETQSPIVQTVVDLLLLAGIATTLGVLLALVALGIGMKCVLLFIAMSYVGFAVAQVATGLRAELIRRLISARWRYFTRQPLGEIANAMSVDATRAGQAYLSSARVLAYGIQVVVYCAVALLASWKIALLALLAGSVITASLHFLVRVMRKAGRRQTARTRELVTYLADALANIKALKAMDQQSTFARLSQRKVDQLRAALRRQFLSRFALEYGQEFLSIMLIAIGFYVAASFFAIPVSELAVIGILLFQTVASLSKAQRYLQKSMQLESPYWNVERLIAEATSAEETLQGTKPARFEQEIALGNVSFAYEGQPVLRNVDLTIENGKVTLITGPSGSGKTTITELILHFITPQSGEVTVDGVPLSDIDVHAWRGGIGYVPQDLVLFHDTIRANVTLGDPTIDDTAVRRALEAAGGWEFVSGLPGGLDSMAGERGGMLSGGQRQRIALARAIVSGPALLILDEVTSALDPQTEADICQRVAKLAGDTTILAITHRDAWRAIADKIYEIDDGRVAPRKDAWSAGSRHEVIS